MCRLVIYIYIYRVPIFRDLLRSMEQVCVWRWRRNIRSERKEVVVLILQLACRISSLCRIKRLQNIGFRLSRACIRRSNPRNADISIQRYIYIQFYSMDISSKFLILDGEVLNYKFCDRNFVYDAPGCWIFMQI